MPKLVALGSLFGLNGEQKRVNLYLGHREALVAGGVGDVRYEAYRAREISSLKQTVAESVSFEMHELATPGLLNAYLSGG